MHLFRLRLIMALIASVTLVSVASTYFEVLAHRHVLREDLRGARNGWGSASSRMCKARSKRVIPPFFPALCSCLSRVTGALGLAIYDTHGNLMASSAPPEVTAALARGVVAEVNAAWNRSGCIRACGQMAVAGRIVSDPRWKRVGRGHGHHHRRQLHPQRSGRPLVAKLLCVLPRWWF